MNTLPRHMDFFLRMESFNTHIGLKLAHKIFAAAEQFSVNLQAKDIIDF